MNTYEYQKLRGLKRKLYLIDLRGSCCEKCGYNKNLSALEFHHKEPGKKESQLDMRRLSNSSMKWILKEFDKCKILCANCHREEHNPKLTISMTRLLSKTVVESILVSKDNKINKPKCCDCGIEINYTYKRCVKCKSKFQRKVEWPEKTTLQREINEHNITWCSNKYGVSRRTIKRWLIKIK